MRSENHWKCVRVDRQGEHGYVKLLSQVVDGLRVYREEHYTAPNFEGDRTLVQERYWTTHRDRAHRTMEAALAACAEPVEPNHP